MKNSGFGVIKGLLIITWELVKEIVREASLDAEIAPYWSGPANAAIEVLNRQNTWSILHV